MPRAATITQAEIKRAITTATACGLVVKRIVLGPKTVELIMVDVDELTEPVKGDGVQPRKW